MNKLLIKSTLATAIALSIAACSPADNEGVAGIGGSGYVSSGSVTGFGSVFVNGVEFETDSSTFDVDGVQGTQDDLAIGMIVQVSGSINADGITGNATSIRYDDQLQGPVKGPITYDADRVTATFTVLGVNVIIDSGSTSFDVSGDVTLPVNTPFDFDSIADNNNIEVSGFFDSSGNLQATRIELKNISFDNSSIIEIKGTISALSSNTFSLGNLSVDASSATLDDLPNGLQNGLFVEVKGTLDASRTTLIATEVDAEDNSVEDSDEFELEGIITDYVDDSNFKVSGIQVDASTASREPSTLTLSNDARIEVEGAIVNGILVASEIESEGGDIKVHAKVTEVNAAAGSFKVSPVAGQEITVTITTGTQLEDDVNEIKQFTLYDLVVNDFVEVRGYDDGSGGITANEIDVKDPDDVIVQSVIQTGSSEALNIVKVLGIEFTIDYPGETAFRDTNELPMTPLEFFSAVTLDSTLIKVKDEDEDGVADEVELETP
jgi:hypothetical protein